MYARTFIDSLDFADHGREIRGEMLVAELPRLQDVLENTRGILSYIVRGGVDNQNNYFLDISVTGHCRVRCQRCLEGMDYPVRLNERLLLRDQARSDALDDSEVDEEDFDSISTDAHLDVADLLEKEILLGLPIALKHEPGACGVMGVGSEHLPLSVFEEALGKLKRN